MEEQPFTPDQDLEISEVTINALSRRIGTLTGQMELDRARANQKLAEYHQRIQELEKDLAQARMDCTCRQDQPVADLPDLPHDPRA